MSHLLAGFKKCSNCGLHYHVDDVCSIDLCRRCEHSLGLHKAVAPDLDAPTPAESLPRVMPSDLLSLCHRIWGDRSPDIYPELSSALIAWVVTEGIEFQDLSIKEFVQFCRDFIALEQSK